MSNNSNDRVMAYHISQTIKHDELDQIAGGAGNGMTCHFTNTSLVMNGKITAQIDYTCDF